MIKVARVPCGSCPYRRDVPPGIWEQCEYDKLLKYDAPTWAQSPKAFMCHQRDGNLCAGWLACHGPHQLLALRLHHDIDPAVYHYATDVPVFSSGAEARKHGMKGIARPGARARKAITGLTKKKSRRR